MECAFCARGECRYGERCLRSQRARGGRQSLLDSDYGSGSDGGSGERGGGSASDEREDANGDDEGHSENSAAESADIEGGWQLQQVRCGAVVLQKRVSPVVVLQRCIMVYAEQVQLLGGRYEALGLDAGDEDEGDAGGAGGEVDAPNF